MGRNPFGQSLIYGEGYDFTPLYTSTSGHMTGAIPVGVMSPGSEDAPYWPASACFTYRQVWVHPASRLLYVLQDLTGGSGNSSESIRLTASAPETAGDQVTVRVTASGRGATKIGIRAWNLKSAQSSAEVDLRGKGEATFLVKGLLERPGAPWLAVIEPEGSASARLEVGLR